MFEPNSYESKLLKQPTMTTDDVLVLELAFHLEYFDAVKSGVKMKNSREDYVTGNVENHLRNVEVIDLKNIPKNRLIMNADGSFEVMGEQPKPDNSDDVLRYRKEFQKAIESGMALTATEDEYVNVRCSEDGKPEIDFTSKKGGE